MSPLILFGLLLMLTFAVIVWILTPPRSELDLRRHLTDIGSGYTTGGGTVLRQRSLSSTPWLNSLLELTPGARGLQLFITGAGSQWTLGMLLFGSLLAAGAAGWVAGLIIGSVPLATILGVAAGAAPYGYLFMKRQARFRRFDELLPETIDLMARALRAGHSVVAAVEMVSKEIAEPVASEFRILFEQQNLGLPIREAVLNLVERAPLDDIKFLATALLVQKETGGNLAEILDKTSAVMRERIRLKGQLKIYTAQARVTGWVLCTLPFAIFVLMNFFNPGYEKKLWTDPLGLRLVYVGLIMMAAGILVIQKIIDIKA
ncbi:MAG: type II secretion system F family protein [Terriglobia bacterium]